MTEDCQKIFYRAEEEFRIQTSVDFLREINIKMMVDHLLERIDVVSFFNAAVNMAGVDLHEEIKMNLLQNMLMLYLRVRSFSLAKDITSKKKSANTSSKALRVFLKPHILEAYFWLYYFLFFIFSINGFSVFLEYVVKFYLLPSN